MRKTGVAFGTFLFAVVLAALPTALNAPPARSATLKRSQLYRDLDLFGDVLQHVRSDYVDKPDDAKLIQSAIDGMLAALDPHSSYLTPQDYREMQAETHGEFGGLGIEVGMEEGAIKVISVMEASPAAKAGLQADDLITQIDKQQVTGLTLEQAVEKMRGPINTRVTLSVMRKGATKPLDLKLVRGTIHLDPIKEREEGDVAYIKISSFSEQTQAGLTGAIKNARRSIGPKLKGYIIDLRNNPGGLLDQAIDVSDDFLDDGTIVLTKGRDLEDTQVAIAHPGDLTKGKKIVVLINGGSASASEIVAGALQDQRRATIIGTRSFGKGSVQTIIPLGANGALRLTTARYYTPSNRSIQAKGIKPDIRIEEELPKDLKDKAATMETVSEASLPGHLKNPDDMLTQAGKDPKEASGSPAFVPKDPEKDAQLQYALSFLRGTARGPQTAANPVRAPSTAKKSTAGIE